MPHRGTIDELDQGGLELIQSLKRPGSLSSLGHSHGGQLVPAHGYVLHPVYKPIGMDCDLALADAAPWYHR